MKVSKKYFLSFFMLLFCTVGLMAQTMEDVVYLENGSVIRGKILEYERDGNIKIEISGGSVLVYKSTEVVKMTKEESLNPTKKGAKKVKRPMHKFQNGRYISLVGGNVFGISDFGTPVPGVLVDAVAGWHFHHMFGIGGGLGYTAMGDHHFVPIYANIRGHFMKSSASLYYDLNIGYGAAIKNNLQMFDGFWGQMEKAEGGLYIRPSLGFRLPSTRKSHMVIDFGYIIQFAKYQYTDWNNNPVIEKRTFYRPSLRLGVIF